MILRTILTLASAAAFAAEPTLTLSRDALRKRYERDFPEHK